jgi:hypothetical protein
MFKFAPLPTIQLVIKTIQKQHNEIAIYGQYYQNSTEPIIETSLFF